jgi:tRNA/rRNA methyltransferase
MVSSFLKNIRIVLVEPAGALNVGSVARVMKNMGLQHLMVVNPQCDVWGDEAWRMAVHGGDVLKAATVVNTMVEGLAGCRRAIATTSIPRALTIALESPQAALPWLLDSNLEPNSVALIFGPEDRGLNNEELSYAHRWIAIPANPVYSSLNLAQAVGICCYELFQLEEKAKAEGRGQRAEGEVKAEGAIAQQEKGVEVTLEQSVAATLDRVEGFYQQLETVLLEIGYLHPHTAASRMQKFRLLFNRAMPTDDEVAMLRGILSQMKWAATKRSGIEPMEKRD